MIKKKAASRIRLLLLCAELIVLSNRNANIVVGRITEECENMIPIQTSIETSVHFLCCNTANVTQKIEYTLMQRRPETSATKLDSPQNTKKMNHL